MVNLFLFLLSSSSFFQTVDHSTLPRETRIRIRIHARMCFGDAHNVPSPQYGNGSWVVSSSCSCTCTHPRTIEFYHIEHTRPSRPLVVSTPPPSFASFSPLYSITLLYNTRKSQYMYIQCTNHRVFLFFFFTLLILTRTRTRPSRNRLRVVSIPWWWNPSPRLKSRVRFRGTWKRKTLLLIIIIPSKNPPSFSIYIYIYKLIGERTRVAVIRVAANAGSIGWLDGAAGASSSTQGKELLLPSSSLFRTSVSYIYIYIYNPLRWCIRACSRRDGRTRPAAKPVSRAPRRRALWCSAFAGTARTSSSSGSLAATRRRWRFFVAVFWAAGAAAVEAETPPGAAAEAWAGRLRATRQGFPCCGFPGNLHLGMRIAVHLVALGIANRVCRRVVLQIQPSPVSPDNWRGKGRRGDGAWEGGGGGSWAAWSCSWSVNWVEFKVRGEQWGEFLLFFLFFWFCILDWLRGDEFDDGVSDFFFSFLTFLVNLEFNFMIIRLLVREAVW